jgi:8-amino-7-oxononanoate synthase
MSLFERWRLHLKALRGQGRLRTLQNPHGIDFCSNDYLGYARHLQADMPAGAEVLSRSGSASRLLSGNHPIWDKVESELARWHGAEAALVMTSGYVANQGLLATVIEKSDWVASDHLNHASIVDGLKLAGGTRHRFAHQDLASLENLFLFMEPLRRPVAARSEIFIVTEALFSMDGDVAPLTALVELAERNGAHVIVDEAHSTGCFGSEGSGLVDALGLRSRVLATVHTGGKALAVPGAYICCSALLKEYLVNRCRHLLYTTALPPQVGAWWLEALEHVRTDTVQRQRLHDNARLFRQELEGRGVAALGRDYIVPVVLGDDAHALQAALALQGAGFDIRAIRPPTVPDGTARLRISIHADHDADTLRRAAAAVAEVAS